MHKILGACLVACLAFAAAACDSMPWQHKNAEDSPVKDADFVESEQPFVGVEIDALWEKTAQVLEANGYPIDDARSRFADHRITSHWNVFLANIRYEGYRTRANVRFRPTASKDGWILGVSVQRQRNVDIDEPSEPARAKWEDTAADDGKTNLLLWKIEAGFRAPGDAPPPAKK